MRSNSDLRDSFLQPEYLLRGCYYTHKDKLCQHGVFSYDEFIPFVVSQVEYILMNPVTSDVLPEGAIGSFDQPHVQTPELSPTAQSIPELVQCESTKEPSPDNVRKPNEEEPSISEDGVAEEILLPPVEHGAEQVINNGGLHEASEQWQSVSVSGNDAASISSDAFRDDVEIIDNVSVAGSCSTASTVACVFDMDWGEKCLPRRKSSIVKDERRTDEFTLKLERELDQSVTIKEDKTDDDFVIRPSETSLGLSNSNESTVTAEAIVISPESLSNSPPEHGGATATPLTGKPVGRKRKRKSKIVRGKMSQVRNSETTAEVIKAKNDLGDAQGGTGNKVTPENDQNGETGNSKSTLDNLCLSLSSNDEDRGTSESNDNRGTAANYNESCRKPRCLKGPGLNMAKQSSISKRMQNKKDEVPSRLLFGQKNMAYKSLNYAGAGIPKSFNKEWNLAMVQNSPSCVVSETNVGLHCGATTVSNGRDSVKSSEQAAAVGSPDTQQVVEADSSDTQQVAAFDFPDTQTENQSCEVNIWNPVPDRISGVSSKLQVTNRPIVSGKVNQLMSGEGHNNVDGIHKRHSRKKRSQEPYSGSHRSKRTRIQQDEPGNSAQSSVASQAVEKSNCENGKSVDVAYNRETCSQLDDNNTGRRLSSTGVNETLEVENLPKLSKRNSSCKVSGKQQNSSLTSQRKSQTVSLQNVNRKIRFRDYKKQNCKDTNAILCAEQPCHDKNETSELSFDVDLDKEDERLPKCHDNNYSCTMDDNQKITVRVNPSVFSTNDEFSESSRCDQAKSLSREEVIVTDTSRYKNPGVQCEVPMDDDDRRSALTASGSTNGFKWNENTQTIELASGSAFSENDRLSRETNICRNVKLPDLNFLSVADNEIRDSVEGTCSSSLMEKQPDLGAGLTSISLNIGSSSSESQKDITDSAQLDSGCISESRTNFSNASVRNIFSSLNGSLCTKLVPQIPQLNEDPKSRTVILKTPIISINRLRSLRSKYDVYCICDVCNRLFGSRRLLLLHKGTHIIENGKRPFPCELCPKSYSAKQALTSHIEVSHKGGNRRFSCSFPGCAFACESRIRIKRHEEAIHKMVNNSNFLKYHCKYCEKTFVYKQSRDHHQRSHTGERPYPCTSCGKNYYDSGTLRRHVMRMHSTIRPHECSACGKKFLNRYDLARHLDRHAGLRPYACERCPSTFFQNSHLKKHLKCVHHIFSKFR